jgi:hypothetical protein
MQVSPFDQYQIFDAIALQSAIDPQSTQNCVDNYNAGTADSGDYPHPVNASRLVSIHGACWVVKDPTSC